MFHNPGGDDCILGGVVPTQGIYEGSKLDIDIFIYIYVCAMVKVVAFCWGWETSHLKNRESL